MSIYEELIPAAEEAEGELGIPFTVGEKALTGVFSGTNQPESDLEEGGFKISRFGELVTSKRQWEEAGIKPEKRTSISINGESLFISAVNDTPINYILTLKSEHE